MPDDGEQQTLEGMDADTKVTLVGVTFKTSEDFELGEAVKLRISGHVEAAGAELLDKEGRRDVVRIRADVIEVD